MLGVIVAGVANPLGWGRAGATILADEPPLVPNVQAPASATADGSSLQQPSIQKGSTATAAASEPYTCFGYTDTFKSGSLMAVDWNGDRTRDECFAIAPNQTIWHAWPRSGAWRVMPNNGVADDTSGAWTDSAGRRVVSVWVNGYGRYCSWLTSSGWQGWHGC
jgi:hypothetical protein